MRVLETRRTMSELQRREGGSDLVRHIHESMAHALGDELLRTGAMQVEERPDRITNTVEFVGRVAVGDPSLTTAGPSARDRAELERIIKGVQTETAQQQMEAELKQQLWDKLDQTVTRQATRTRTPPAPPPPVPSSIRGRRADTLLLDDPHDDKLDAMRLDPAAFTREILAQGWPDWAGPMPTPKPSKPAAPTIPQLPRAEVQKLRDYVKELEPKILGETSGQYVAGLILSRIDEILK